VDELGVILFLRLDVLLSFCVPGDLSLKEVTHPRGILVQLQFFALYIAGQNTFAHLI
jgi:hypothetical protein